MSNEKPKFQSWFRLRLIRQGVSPEEADRTLARLKKRIAQETAITDYIWKREWAEFQKMKAGQSSSLFSNLPWN